MARHAAPSVMTSFSCCQNEPGPPSGRKGEAIGWSRRCSDRKRSTALTTRENSRVSRRMGMPTRVMSVPIPVLSPVITTVNQAMPSGRLSTWKSVAFHVRASISGWTAAAITPRRGGVTAGTGVAGGGGTPALPAADVAGPGGGGGGRVCMGASAAGGDRLVLRDVDRSRWRQGRAGEVGARRPVGPGDGRMAFDGEAGDEPVQPAGQPPVGAAEQLHGGGHEHHPDEGGVDQHGDGQTEPDELDGAGVARPRSCRTRTP